MKFHTRCISRGKLGAKRLIEMLPQSCQFPLERVFYRAIHEPELKLLKHLCQRRKLAIDVGANKGIYALFLTALADRVVCFEPNPRLAGYLKAKFCGTNVAVENCALGRQAGQLELRIPCIDGMRLEGWGSLVADFHQGNWQGNQITRTERFDVAVNRLDGFGFRDVGFIKIDVEGFEAAVLEGAMETLERERPNVLIELERRLNPDMADAFSLFAGLEYAGYFLENGRMRPLEAFDLDTMQDPRYLDDRTRYINNFVFLPQEAGRPGL